jgi:hypothetical protein
MAEIESEPMWVVERYMEMLGKAKELEKEEIRKYQKR